VSSRIKFRNYRNLFKVVLFLMLIQWITPCVNTDIFDVQHRDSHSISAQNFDSAVPSFLFEETKNEKGKENESPFRFYVIEDFSFPVVRPPHILAEKNQEQFLHPPLFRIYHSYLI
jgi:hypothetical protein